MSSGFVFIFMIFMHVLDDFFIQAAGCLSFLKTKDFWEKEAPEELYKNDYKMALLAHGISWAFMIMLPIFILNGFKLSLGISTAFWINAWIHMYVDDLKANKKKINLIVDQCIHYVQIIITALVFLI